MPFNKKNRGGDIAPHSAAQTQQEAMSKQQEALQQQQYMQQLALQQQEAGL